MIILFMSSLGFSKTFVVKLNAPLDDKIRKEYPGQWKKFTSYSGSEYFQDLYLYRAQKESLHSLSFSHSYVDRVEETTTISATSIEPNENRESNLENPLLPYQWGLLYQGQKVYNELNDLENILIPGQSDADIGIKNLDSLEQKFKKDIIVAVIDTGVDFNHPDLKENIYVNEVECDNGEIPYEPEQSNDDNKYPGDCKGWDFTDKDELGSNRPEDFVGHGTHIAGIISAVKDNYIGLAGLSNRIKILPIKVLSNKSEDSQALGTSDRLSNAILYAVEMKVDVINLSLGWPLSFDKEHLRQAVLEAVKNNIMVVAAAGNNDHSEPIMPCAYPGVICVGATDPDRKMSDFSNYGAHVDVLAPGNNILSTFPTAETPLFFDFNGYEIKSGTSQAAPYVSALLATLKGINPELTTDEVKARLFGSTAGPYLDKTKFSSGNLIHFQKALSYQGKVLKPSFKGFNRVKLNLKNRSFEFSIPFKDYSTNVEKALVKISAGDKLNLEKKEFFLNASQREVTVRGTFKTADANLLQKFELNVEFEGHKNVYHFEKRFFIDFSDIESTHSYEIVGANPKSITQLNTVNYYHMPYDFPYYYTESEHKEGIIISLFTRKGNRIQNIGTTLVKEAKSILSLHRLDANLDGKPDILIRSLIEQDNSEGEVDEEGNVLKEQTIMYSYLTQELRPLFFEEYEENGQKRRKDLSQMKLNFEGVILQDLDDFAFGKMSYGDFGEILVPVYLAYSDQLPEADRNPNPFARLRRRAFSARLYYYEPLITETGPKLVTRTFNDNNFVDALKRKIRFKPFEQIFVVKFLKQSFADIKAGKFKLMVSHESERKLPRNYLLEINDIKNKNWNIKKTNGINLNLSQFITERAFSLDKDAVTAHIADEELVGYEESSDLMWEEFQLKGNRLEYISLVQDDPKNTLEFPIKTYIDGETKYHFYLTPSKIFLEKRSQGHRQRFSYPVHVSSFLPGVLFREQHFPISFVHKGKKYPALYVDATQISSRNIYLTTTTEEGNLYGPVKFNVNIPENCKALNPVVIDQYKYEYSIQCFEKSGKSFLYYIPLED